ncbi:MAG: tRNA pseudouridine(13) synthase TruD [DPANN group archaeon]|nr:tRNA pseudouridine(13) synthase TruD [DPANN group archaeon]
MPDKQAYEIKKSPEDFIVEEITPQAQVMKINTPESFDSTSKGEYLICKLQKTNWDNQQALKAIAKQLRMSHNKIGIAGTKDKKAVTAQRVSLPAEKIGELKGIRIRDIELQPIYFSDAQIMLGDLSGNKFTIKVYTEREPRSVTKIPNYFGEQRFGKTRAITDVVGGQILKRNYEQAVKIYLCDIHEKEEKESLDARRKLVDNWGDFHGALQYYPMHLKYERTLLGYLDANPGDFRGAINSLPRRIKKMFVHAFQSRLFNEFLDIVIERKLNYTDGPLFGSQTKFMNPLEREVFEKHGLEKGAFEIRELKELSSKGHRRALYVELRNFNVLESTQEYKVVQFELPKGSYATVAIEELFA